jgi:hypothetical protein
MKTYIAQTDAEAHGLHDGTVTEIVLPVEQQPYTPEALPHCWCWDKPTGGRVTWNKRNPGYPQCIEDACPYQPGDRAAVLEAWGMDPNDSGYKLPDLMQCLFYRAEWDQPEPYHWGWNDPEFLPAWAVRTHLLCEAVTVRQTEGTWYFVCQVKKESPCTAH